MMISELIQKLKNLQAGLVQEAVMKKVTPIHVVIYVLVPTDLLQ